MSGSIAIEPITPAPTTTSSPALKLPDVPMIQPISSGEQAPMTRVVMERNEVNGQMWPFYAWVPPYFTDSRLQVDFPNVRALMNGDFERTASVWWSPEGNAGATDRAADVPEAAAVGVKDHQRDEEVKAYIVLKPGATPQDVPPRAIFDHCATRLAAFKIPRYLEYREALPKTPSEKIAKQKLVEEKPDLRAGSFDRVSNAWL